MAKVGPPALFHLQTAQQAQESPRLSRTGNTARWDPGLIIKATRFALRPEKPAPPLARRNGRNRLARGGLLTKAARAARGAASEAGRPFRPRTPLTDAHPPPLAGSPAPLPFAGPGRDGVRAVERRRGRAAAAGVGAGAGVHLGSADAAAAAAAEAAPAAAARAWAGGGVVRGEEAWVQGGAGAQGSGGGHRRAPADAGLAQLQALLPEEDSGRRPDLG